MSSSPTSTSVWRRSGRATATSSATRSPSEHPTSAVRSIPCRSSNAATSPAYLTGNERIGERPNPGRSHRTTWNRSASNWRRVRRGRARAARSMTPTRLSPIRGLAARSRRDGLPRSCEARSAAQGPRYARGWGSRPGDVEERGRAVLSRRDVASRVRVLRRDRPGERTPIGGLVGRYRHRGAVPYRRRPPLGAPADIRSGAPHRPEPRQRSSSNQGRSARTYAPVRRCPAPRLRNPDRRSSCLSPRATHRCDGDHHRPDTDFAAGSISQGA